MSWRVALAAVIGLSFAYSFLALRVKRHYRRGGGWRQRLAARWAARLNAVRAGHV